MDKPKEKKKYWYATTTYVCPICNKEKICKSRVYDEKEKGYEFINDYDYCQE
jgi:hypothetical protein